MNNLLVLSREIEEAIEAKMLLDKILSYYNIYTGQFKTIPDSDCDLVSHHSLNNKVRHYLKFNDSK